MLEWSYFLLLVAQLYLAFKRLDDLVDISLHVFVEHVIVFIVILVF